MEVSIRGFKTRLHNSVESLGHVFPGATLPFGEARIPPYVFPL